MKWTIEKRCGNWYITPPCGDRAHVLTIAGDGPRATFADVLNVVRDRGPIRGSIDCPHLERRIT